MQVSPEHAVAEDILNIFHYNFCIETFLHGKQYYVNKHSIFNEYCY